MRIAFVGDSITSGMPGCGYLKILEGELPEHSLINLGKGNDTAVSLYRRIAGLQFDAPFDLAFLWVGINDVPRQTPWAYHLAGAMLRQRPSKNLDEFRVCYQGTLDLLCRNAKHVITVSPLLKGENLDAPWNKDLEVICDAIQTLTTRHENATYLDIRRSIVQKLASLPTSDYVPTRVLQAAVDILTVRTDAQADARAKKRGLHFTFDGIHLNSAGAKFVAGEFLDVMPCAIKI